MGAFAGPRELLGVRRFVLARSGDASVHMLELFVGAYDSGDDGGLYPLTYSSDKDCWTVGEPDTGIRNVSYAAWNPRHDVYVFAHESSSGKLGCYRRKRNGWQRLHETESGGSAPCFVAIDPDGGSLVVANYESGEVALFPVSADTGCTTQGPVLHRNEGSGPHPDRQAGPHPHCARFAYGRVYSTDLGTDEILVHSAHEAGGSYTALKLPAGQGPRHIVFHPARPLAYLLTELGSTLFTLSVGNDGELAIVHELSTLPSGFQGESLGGHVELNAAGDRLYVTNRGHDSIVVFDTSADHPRMLQSTDTGGASPRHFCLLEEKKRIVIAHEKQGGVTVLALSDDGKLSPARDRIAIPKACFVGRIERPWRAAPT
jgi:6-phosphogluconolactonase